MSDDVSRLDHAAGVYPIDQPPELGSMRALAERAELADAVSGLTDGGGCWLADSDPLGPLARQAARDLLEAGFTLHHCAQHHPLYRLGRVCLLPVDNGHDLNGKGGSVVSWSTHDLLSLGWDRWTEYHSAYEVMNGALSQVLDALGYQVWPFGLGGAWTVTGRARDEDSSR